MSSRCRIEGDRSVPVEARCLAEEKFDTRSEKLVTYSEAYMDKADKAYEPFLQDKQGQQKC